MDILIEKLLLLQLKNIEETAHLGKLSKEKLISIVEKSKINFEIIEYKESCWIWDGMSQHTTKGHCHGKIWFKGNYRFVHRLMYHNFVENVPEFTRLPDSLQVNHICSHNQNGKCINPWHLYLGTPKENTSDSINEGTFISTPKVFFNNVKDIIIQMRSENKSINKIAEHLTVSSNTVNRWIKKLDLKKNPKHDDEIKNEVISMKKMVILFLL